VVQINYFLGWVEQLNSYEYPDTYFEVYKKPITIEQKIRQKFPENPELFVAIAKAESNLNPNAYNPEGHRGCSGSIGIFQIACLHTDNPDKLFDVDINLEYARKIYDRDGLKVWGAFTDLRYLAYLN
jgi:soluble lytic murein transglycosylase-like protein